MLNIPDSVKALFKRDGVRKNFRVHFPNGELPDITNENIVQESVTFTESLSSQSVFKFGLAEASVIEFETVGIPNMFGMMIECGIEIDLSSLSSAQINDIASGTWDGVYTSAALSDIGYAYFRIPYGSFRVDKCPRNQGAMTHRKVTGYARGMTADSIVNLWQKKLETAFTELTNVFTPNTKALFYTHFCKNDPDLLLSYGYTKTVKSLTGSTSTVGGLNDIQLKTSTQQDATFHISNIVPYYTYIDSDWDEEAIVHIQNLGSEHIEETRGFMKDFLSTYDIDPVASGYEDWDDLTETLVNTANTLGQTAVARSRIRLYSPELGEAISGKWWIQPNDPPVLVYPHRNNSWHGVIGFCCAVGVRFILNGLGSQKLQAYMFTNKEEIWTYLPTTQTPFDALTSAFNSTLTRKITTGDGDVKVYSLANSYSALDLFEGVLELTATFLKNGRNIANSIVRLDNSSPVSVDPSQYEELWWDEYDVEPIGLVVVRFDEENTAQVSIGSGASRYDMTDNKIVASLEGFDLTTITNLINTEFAPHIADVNFTPIDLTMRGLPWIEAGDALEIEAEDGTIVDSYALRIELDGVQYLHMDVTADGGEIIDNVNIEEVL